MPAAAVIPAPVAYIKVVAVKKLVVGFRVGRHAVTGVSWQCLPGCYRCRHPYWRGAYPSVKGGQGLSFTLTGGGSCGYP